MVALTPGDGDDFIEYGPLFRFLNHVSAMLSIGGSIAVIGTFIAFPQLRRFFARLVVYLAISDLWLCTSMLFGPSRAPHYTKCNVQAIFNTFFGLASIMWTLAIAESVRRVLLAQDLSVETGFENKLHAVCWGLPCVAVIAVVATGVLGPAGMMCWITNTAIGTVMRFLTFYVPLWLAIGYSAWVYWYVTAMMHQLLVQQQTNGGADSEATVLDVQADLERQRYSLHCMLLLPLVLVFCWTPSTVRRLVDIFVPDLGATPLDYICVFCGPLQGVLNALVYGATPAVRDAVFGRLDHSARKLRGIQARLKASKPKRPRRFEKLLEERGPLEEEEGPPRERPPPEPPRSADASPQPEALGRPAEEHFHTQEEDPRPVENGQTPQSTPRGSADAM